ncbi:MAG: site-specific integrase [Actinobacteria bacterium]|nr:MAG: site-specific integrase [Actinomycetota bacterium]
MRRDVGSVTEIGPGLWAVQVSLGADPVTGKRRRPLKRVRGSRRDAERQLLRMLAEHGQSDSTTITVEAFIDGMYLPYLAERVRAGSLRRRTADEYEAKLKRYVTPKIGSVKLEQLRPYTLDRWLSSLCDLGLSPRTRIHAYRVLSTAMSTAVRWRLIPSNPLAAVSPPKAERRAPRVLSVAEANAYLDAFSGHALEPVVVIALGAGLRRSELCALDWSDVDLDAATVRVDKGRHERKGETWNEPPKSATSRRIVSLPEWAVASLRPHRGLGPVCGTMKPSSVSYWYKKHVDDSGLAWCPLKNLRHSSATIALALGVDVVVVSRRLGHSTVSITDQFYLAPGREADVDAAAKMGELRQLPATNERVG